MRTKQDVARYQQALMAAANIISNAIYQRGVQNKQQAQQQAVRDILESPENQAYAQVEVPSMGLVPNYVEPGQPPAQTTLRQFRQGYNYEKILPAVAALAMQSNPYAQQALPVIQGLRPQIQERDPYKEYVRVDPITGRQETVKGATEKPYTLSPGQIRFEGRDRVASTAPKPITKDFISPENKKYTVRIDPLSGEILGVSEIGEVRESPMYVQNVDPSGELSVTPVYKSKEKAGEAIPIGQQRVPEPPGSAGRRELISKLSALEANLVQYQALLTKVPGGRIRGTIEQVKAWAEQNPIARTIEGMKNSMTGMIARVIGGEVGVLTDQDIKRAEKLVPLITDTEEERALKFKEINQLIEERKAALGLNAQPAQQQSIDNDPLGVR